MQYNSNKTEDFQKKNNNKWRYKSYWKFVKHKIIPQNIRILKSTTRKVEKTKKTLSKLVLSNSGYNGFLTNRDAAIVTIARYSPRLK